MLIDFFEYTFKADNSSLISFLSINDVYIDVIYSNISIIIICSLYYCWNIMQRRRMQIRAACYYALDIIIFIIYLIIIYYLIKISTKYFSYFEIRVKNFYMNLVSV